MKILVVLSALALSGCVSLGLSQADSETTYTLAAIAADTAILSGQLNPVATGQICLIDNANYRILIATRNVADMTSYSASDSAHATLQKDGARLNASQCVAP